MTTDLAIPPRRAFLLRAAAVGVAASQSLESAGGAARDLSTSHIPNTELVVSRLGLGCDMRGLDSRSPDFVGKAVELINTAFDNGITLFDLADIYGGHRSEVAMGEALRRSPGLRRKIVIQSKCGILYRETAQPNLVGVDLSRQHIVHSVEKSLRDLRTEYLDLFLLHEPDPLVEPEEVAQAFDDLQRSGKVRYFGVCNHTAMQIELLRKYSRHPLVVNQFHLSLAKLYPAFNYPLGGAHYMAESGIVEYCRLNGIQIQAWSPLRGLLNPREAAEPGAKLVSQLLKDLASKKQTTAACLAVAWLLRHPASIVPLLGSTSPAHLTENCAATRLQLSREEWYALFAAASAV